MDVIEEEGSSVRVGSSIDDPAEDANDTGQILSFEFNFVFFPISFELELSSGDLEGVFVLFVGGGYASGLELDAFFAVLAFCPEGDPAEISGGEVIAGLVSPVVGLVLPIDACPSLGSRVVGDLDAGWLGVNAVLPAFVELDVFGTDRIAHSSAGFVGAGDVQGVGAGRWCGRLRRGLGGQWQAERVRQQEGQ